MQLYEWTNHRDNIMFDFCIFFPNLCSRTLQIVYFANSHGPQKKAGGCASIQSFQKIGSVNSSMEWMDPSEEMNAIHSIFCFTHSKTRSANYERYVDWFCLFMKSKITPILARASGSSLGARFQYTPRRCPNPPFLPMHFALRPRCRRLRLLRGQPIRSGPLGWPRWSYLPRRSLVPERFPMVSALRREFACRLGRKSRCSPYECGWALCMVHHEQIGPERKNLLCWSSTSSTWARNISKNENASLLTCLVAGYCEYTVDTSSIVLVVWWSPFPIVGTHSSFTSQKTVVMLVM